MIICCVASVMAAEFDNGTLFYDFNSGSGNTIDRWGSYDGINNGNVTFDNADFPTFNISGTGEPYSTYYDRDAWFNTTYIFMDNDPYTVAFWYKAEVGSGSNAFIGGRDGATSAFSYMRITNTDIGHIVGNPAATNRAKIINTSIINDGSWHLAVADRSGNNITLYVDDVLAGRNTTVTIQDPFNLSVLLGVYSDKGNPDILYEGWFDNFMVFDRVLTEAERSRLYNYGQLTIPPPTYFNLTVVDNYDNAAISNFTAQINNGTGILNITTTNGTIYYYEDLVINLTIFNISIGNYFNISYENYNTSTNLVANTSGTNIEINFLFNGSTVPINITTVNFYDSNNALSFSTSNGTLYLNPTPNERIYFNIYDNDILLNRTLNYIFPGLDTSTYNVELQEILTNLTFFDSTDNSPIASHNITINYPSSASRTLTTDAEGSIYFSYVYNNILELGSYDIIFSAILGYVSPVTFARTINAANIPYNENFSISRTNLFINIYDREDSTLLTGVDVEVFMQGVFNYTTSNGTLVLNNLTVAADDYTLVAVAEGYYTEQITTAFTNQDNLTINFYLLNTTGTNTGSHFVNVINEFSVTQPDTLVRLLELDLVTDTAKQVSECISNNNGECFFGVELGVKKYIITGTKIIDGQTYSDSTNEEGIFINIDNDITELFLKVASIFSTTSLTDLSYEIEDNLRDIYNDLTNTTNINITFSTVNNDATTLCLDYYIFSNNTLTLDDYSCVVSSTGLIQSSKALNRSNNYRIQAYQLESGYKIIIYSKNVMADISLEQRLKTDELLSPFVLLPFIALLALSFWARRIMWFWIGTPIIAWIELAVFPSIMLLSVCVIITFICIFEAVISLKKMTEAT